ncbi:MAG: HAMP domain-containing sensor histidine kinase [Coriobacteriales bacterium]|nr:HAMP domain-containing sensor histidine kinase [Coriobacteriales bacterium]
MLNRLRREFIIIIMALVGTVLVIGLGLTYYSSWHTQHALINEALDRGLEGELVDFPHFDTNHIPSGPSSTEDGSNPAEDGRKDEKRLDANVLVLVVDINSEGVVIQSNEAPILTYASALSEIIKEALSSDVDHVWDTGSHIAWKRIALTSETWRVVIADTSTTDISLGNLFVRDLVTMVVVLVVLFFISVGLSGWVLKPVQQAWDQQQQFVADSSHELKTPLAVIIANTQILMKEGAIPQESHRWIESTADEAAHMKKLVEELLELARADESSSGNTSIMQREDIDFSSMVESAALEFDALAFERGAMIEEDIEQGIHITGDPEWMGRVSKILIENACKYTDAARPIEVKLKKQGHKCTYSVTNSGNTIDPEDLPHVFDRFYRTDKARSRNEKTGGFGLGLAIAKGIVTSHNGTITVSSTKEEGTTFRVTLPVAG